VPLVRKAELEVAKVELTKWKARATANDERAEANFRAYRQAEAERDEIFYEFTADMTDSSDEWTVTMEWLSKDFPHLAAHYARDEK
jgi:hypothetical protein